MRGGTPITDTDVPVLSWDEFRAEWEWSQGEHITAVGPTKSGKSTLVAALLAPDTRCSDYVCLFATKRRDPLIDEYVARGYVKLPQWIVSEPDILPRVIIAPSMRKGFDSEPERRQVFRHAMNAILRQGGWILNLTETRYIAGKLRLGDECETLWHMGRTEGVTVVSESQRPRHIPLMAYDQATHLFMFRNSDEQSLRRLGEIGGAFDARLVRETVRVLEFHQMLYVNTETGVTYRTMVQL